MITESGGTSAGREAANDGHSSASEAFWDWFAQSAKGAPDPKPLRTDAPPLPSFGYAITGAATRRYPSARTRREIVARQRNRCLYCGHRIGAEVWRGDRRVQLRVNWDHFVPYVYARANRSTNWVLACQICNSIKSCHIFSTVMEAQRFIRERLAEKGVSVAPVIEGIDVAPVIDPIQLPQRSFDARPSDVEEAWRHVRCGLVRGTAGTTHVQRNRWTPLGLNGFEAFHRTSEAADVIWYAVAGDPSGLTVAAAVLRTGLTLGSHAISANFPDDEEAERRHGPLALRFRHAFENRVAA